jgi:hypothetical protein
MWAPGLLAQTVTVGFDEVDASGGILRANLARADDPVTDYLARNGIEIVDQLPEGRDLYVVIDARNDYGFVAPSHPNVFSQMGSNGLISYRFRFKSPLSAFSLTRARLRAGPTGITHPIWRATAIDKEGRKGEPVGEGWIAEYSTVPERIFTMPLPPGGEISEVEIAADNRSVAAFSSVVLDDLVLTHPDNAPKTP